MSNEVINDYAEQLKQLCDVCRKNKKCKHDKLCAFKKLAWTMAKRKLAKERKDK